MSNNELLNKIKEYADIKRMANELANSLSAIEDEIKAYMGENEKLNMQGYEVSYTKYEASRFDSTTFKKEHNAMYEQYVKKIIARRFAVRG